MELMLSITEEFYQINNTSANHNKYVLITNLLPLFSVSSPSPDLHLSGLNKVPSISIMPISMNSSFRFLGVWFNIAGSRDFVKKQVRPAKLSAKQVVYLHNTVLIPKLEYRMQVTHLSESECTSATSKMPIFHAHFLILYCFCFKIAFNSIFFFDSYFPIVSNNWTIWSKLPAFRKDYIACTIALLTTTPFKLLRSQLSTLPVLTIPNGHTPLFDVMTPKIFISYF
ncbi:hypothetical protein RhiirA5_413450 [Rhizophagus irregularis]|uniref:Uncharacterized protein n=1 Tax=Rhizophagus irregularis TaxID=588596 RepID=A0A2N0PWB1_9GLOM|nr:hypothetical protein RhiirA5_413450 [Rhizophagus irregularis]